LKDMDEFLVLFALSTNVAQHNISFLTAVQTTTWVIKRLAEVKPWTFRTSPCSYSLPPPSLVATTIVVAILAFVDTYHGGVQLLALFCNMVAVSSTPFAFHPSSIK